MSNTKVFPVLTEKESKPFRENGRKVTFEKGEILIREGVRNYDFYLIEEGEVDIIDPYDNKSIIATHGPGEFTGDSDMLSERASLFIAKASVKTVAWKINHQDLQRIIAGNSKLSDKLIQAFMLRRAVILEGNNSGVLLIGSRNSSDTFKIRSFLDKNRVRHIWQAIEDHEDIESMFTEYKVSKKDLPILVKADKSICKNPNIRDIADAVGLSTNASNETYDLLVVGAGPAGLAASVYGASEGLTTITIDAVGPGGQAGNSSKIENYLGFPTGISGQDLATNAYIQAQKFGCTFSVPFKAIRLSKKDKFYCELENGLILKSYSVIAATGAEYRSLNIKNLNHFIGRGLYYGATEMEARICSDQDVFIVGAGNSAGQAAIFLAEHASHITMLIRSDNLEKSMSQYLITRINRNPKISVKYQCEVSGLEGKDSLERISFYDKKQGKEEIQEIGNLFLFIGAQPANGWLDDVVSLDNKGFIETGRDMNLSVLEQFKDVEQRSPFLLETKTPGLFAVGDIRSNNTKRVASAVGEGSMAVSFVHQYLATRRSKL